jgi:NAD(P)-dependent dehydrogenase (short-subunit alcohol dehydrogenase family)
MRVEQMQGEQQANAQRSPLTGRGAIVTGGGRGLGRAMVLGLAQAGVYVIATAARESAELEAVAQDAEQTCGEARVIPHMANVTREEDCSQVVETALSRFGRLDILLNNAGWFRRIPTG